MTYKIFQAIECLRNLLEYDGSRDACSKWRQRFSVKTIIMNRVMDTRLNVTMEVVEAVFFLFQATLLCNGSSVGSHQVLSSTWSG